MSAEIYLPESTHQHIEAEKPEVVVIFTLISSEINNDLLFVLNWADNNAVRIWNRPLNELLGQPITTLHQPADSQFLQAQCRLVHTHNRPACFIINVPGNEPTTPYQLYLSPTPDGLKAIYRPAGGRSTASVPQLTNPQQESLLQKVIDNAQTGIVLYKIVPSEGGKGPLNFTILMANPINEQVSGQPLHTVIGHTVQEKFPGLMETQWGEKLVLCATTGENQQFLFPYHREGIDGWFDVSFVRHQQHIIFTFLDVTKLKNAEIQQQKQARTLQQVVDSAPVGLLLARPEYTPDGTLADFRYVLTNAFNARLCDKTVDQMTGQLVGDLFPGWQESDLYQRFTQVLTTEESQRITFPYTEFGIDGWFDGYFSLIDGCVLYTYVDVTPLKKAQLAQQKESELLEQVMNTTPTAIVLHESVRNEAGVIIDFRMTRLNQAAADHVGLPIAEMQGQLISTIFPGALDALTFRKYKEIIDTGQSGRVELSWGTRWFDFSIAKFGDGVIVATQDITAIRRNRHELELANLSLQRSNENLQAFAFVASHDLQEPLRKITSFANVLTTQFHHKLPSDVQDIIDRMTLSAERMRLLIQDLLTYSQVQTKQEAVKQVSLTGLIKEIQNEELWAAIYQSKAVIMLEDLPTVQADPLQMRQLFQNLLANAIKFTPKGVIPAIQVTSRVVRPADVPEVALAADQMAHKTATGSYFYELSVCDNGIGFDEKHAARIFQVFQRLHGRSQYAGSGIGLAICAKIAERHGGSIAVTSEPGKGSTFRVYLPTQEAPTENPTL